MPLKIIAFFNLKKETDINEFHDWVVNTQTPVFKDKLSRMNDFKVFQLTDSDNYSDLPQIVQIFEWEGTQQQWRETIEGFQSGKDRDLLRVAEEWENFCVGTSTQILYADNIR